MSSDGQSNDRSLNRAARRERLMIVAFPGYQPSLLPETFKVKVCVLRVDVWLQVGRPGSSNPSLFFVKENVFIICSTFNRNVSRRSD